MNSLPQDIPLVSKNLLQYLYCDITAGLVIFPPFTNSVHILIFSILLYSLFPVFIDMIPVFHIVPGFIGIFMIPFSTTHIISEHGFNVGRTHHNAILVSDHSVLFIIVERFGLLMHRRPEQIGLQSEQ